MKTFQYRIYPNKKQQEKLWLHANKLNWLYNYFLNQRIENYKLGIKTGRKEQQKELVVLKENDPILAEIHSQVLQQVTLRLDQSYRNFFRTQKSKNNGGFPKFRSCNKFFGICYPQSGFWLNDNKLKTKAYGEIKFNKHRNWSGNIKQIQITNKNNRWFLNVITNFIESIDNKKEIIGIDLGLTNLVVASDGLKVKNCTHAKYFDKQISKIQSRTDKLNKGSRKQKFYNNLKRKLYELKNRKINDFQHKISRDLSRKYNTIYMEDLSVKKMSESNKTGLNKAIRNAKLANFAKYLQYKTHKLLKVNPYNTSKTCNSCGKIHQNLILKDRTIICECGRTYDRDENASQNIFCLGQAIDLGLCSELATIQEALTFK